MSGMAEKKRKFSLSREEYSVLVSSVCFLAVVLAVIGIAIYKLVRICLHAG